jgi:hypothetical protein
MTPCGSPERFTREWNAGASPLTWVKTTDQILAKGVRKAQGDSGAALQGPGSMIARLSGHNLSPRTTGRRASY